MKLPTSILNRLALFSVIAVGVMVGSVFATENADYVQLISMALGPVGISAAVLCGLAFAQYVSVQSSIKKSSGRGVVFGFGLIAAVFLLLVFNFSGFSLDSLAESWVFIPAYAAVAAAVLAFLASRYARPNIVPPPAIKFLLIGGAFIGGVLPGLALYFILSLIVSDRYCQLTSSKCM